MDFDVNWLAVLLAALAAFVLGMLWYSPVLFGKAWMAEMKLKQADMKGANMGRTMLLAAVFQILSAYVLVHFLLIVQGSMADVLGNDYASAAQCALWLWLGFMLPINFGAYLWEGKSLKLVLINTSHSLATLVLSALVLTAVS